VLVAGLAHFKSLRARMKRDRIVSFSFCALLFLCALAVAVFQKTSYDANGQLIVAPNVELSTFDFNFDIFYPIVTTNILVILVVSILGFCTAGVVSVIIIAWNGFQWGLLFSHIALPFWETVKYLVFHGTFEFLAFCYSGVFGLEGLRFYINLYKSNTLPSRNVFYYLKMSLILVLLGAIIETILISSSQHA